MPVWNTKRGAAPVHRARRPGAVDQHAARALGLAAAAISVAARAVGADQQVGALLADQLARRARRLARRVGAVVEQAQLHRAAEQAARRR